MKPLTSGPESDDPLVQMIGGPEKFREYQGLSHLASEFLNAAQLQATYVVSIESLWCSAE